MPSPRNLLLPVAAGFAAAVLASGCGASHAEADRPEWPKVLRYSVSINHENPETEAGRLDIVGRYLERRMGMPVEVNGTTGYGAVIEAFRARKIEAGSIGPFAYLIATRRTEVEAIATRGELNGESRLYSGTLSVAAASRLRSIEDVIRRSRELTISFVDPASASGNLVQRAYLLSVGLTPERDFRKVMFTTSHMASALTLAGGKVDVAAVGESILQMLIKSGKLRSGDIRTLWVSPRIPESPVAVRKELPLAFKQRFQQALVDMATDAPDAYRNMTAKIYFERYRNTRFVPATDALYEPIRKLFRGVEQFQGAEP